MIRTRKRSEPLILGLILIGGCAGQGETEGLDPKLLTLEQVPPRTFEGRFYTETLNFPEVGARTVTYQMVDGKAIYEGDIVLDLERLRQAPDVDSSRTAARRNEFYRWPGGVVPFTIDSNLGGSDARVSAAIAHWQANTPIRFIARTNETAYINFKDGTGCSTSAFGRDTNGDTIILDHTACSTGNAIHEIGHAMGLFHEQSRSDRDSWVTVNWGNIKSGYSSQFNTYLQMGTDGWDNGAFDFGSVMLYDSFAFSANGMPTMVKKDGTTFGSQRNGLSGPDILAVGRMYPRFSSFSSDNMPTIASNVRPAITSWARNRLDVLAVATDGTLRHQYSSDGGSSWSGWVDNWGGNFTSGISAASWGPGRIDVVGKGSNSSLWHFWYDNGATGWDDRGIQMQFEPGISSWSSGNLDVFCVGTDKAGKHQSWRSGVGWSGWENMGGVLTTGVDSVSWGPNRIDVVSRNSWNRIVRNAWINGWSGWADQGGSLSSSTPTIASKSVNHLDMFAQFADGTLNKLSWELGWEQSFGPAGGSPLAQPDVVSDDVARFDVVGLSGGLVRHESVRNN
jgi:Astacin (Peptidase family M12A)